MASEKQHTIQLMLEQEERHLDTLRQEMAANPSEKVRVEMEAGVKRAAKLREQLQVGLHPSFLPSSLRIKAVFKNMCRMHITGEGWRMDAFFHSLSHSVLSHWEMHALEMEKHYLGKNSFFLLSRESTPE